MLLYDGFNIWHGLDTSFHSFEKHYGKHLEVDERGEIPMGIKERITTRLNEERDDKSQKLWEVCQSVVSNVIQHNKLIISQMSN